MVEHLLAKEKVAGSNPVFRSSFPLSPHFAVLILVTIAAQATRVSSRSATMASCSRSGGMVDAAVSKTVEGKPHAGSNPAFGTNNPYIYE